MCVKSDLTPFLCPLTLQAHMQSGMHVPQHHGTPSHPVMLMATQAGPQPPLPQNTLNPIPVSSTTHFSYMAHPSGIQSTFSAGLNTTNISI